MNGTNSPTPLVVSTVARKRVLFFVLLILIAVVLVGAWWYFSPKPVNHKIAGVPYHGYYNHFFDAFFSRVTAELTIFDYYGDTRFTAKQLMDEQYHSRPSAYYTTNDLAQFFADNGYRTAMGTADTDVISQIKQFIKQDIPVLVLMKVSTATTTYAVALQPVIGTFDDSRTVVLHDFIWGSDAVIPYDQFQARYVAGSLLAVWPAESIKKTLKGTQPNRLDFHLPAMNSKVGTLLAIRAEAVQIKPDGKLVLSPPDILQAYQQIMASQNFSKLHPALQVLIYEEYVANLLNQKQADEAIKVLTEKVLPLNHDFDKPYNGWQIDLKTVYPTLKEPVFAWPWVQLADAYALKGNQKQAEKELKKAYSVHPGYLKETFFLVWPHFAKLPS